MVTGRTEEREFGTEDGGPGTWSWVVSGCSGIFSISKLVDISLFLTEDGGVLEFGPSDFLLQPSMLRPARSGLTAALYPTRFQPSDRGARVSDFLPLISDFRFLISHFYPSLTPCAVAEALAQEPREGNTKRRRLRITSNF